MPNKGKPELEVPELTEEEIANVVKPILCNRGFMITTFGALDIAKEIKKAEERKRRNQ